VSKSDLDGSTGVGDDLRRIRGIGPRVATALEQLGIGTMEELARCTPEGLSSRLRESGLRISPKVIRNSNWIAQAKRLVAAKPRAKGNSELEPERRAAEEQPPAAADVQPSLAVGRARRVGDVTLSVVTLPAQRRWEGRLEATVEFTLRGVPNDPEPPTDLAARVRVYAVSLGNDARKLVSIDEVHIEPGGGRYSTRHPFECPPKGRYRFEATVQVLDGSNTAARAKSGPYKIAA
jgi:hypothetical protein